jgi:ribonuclease BN (tRNA processing enzyme)
MSGPIFASPKAFLAPPELQLELPGLTLLGTSLAARATAFAVPELGLALDLGRLTPHLAEQGTVLLSHGHLDHLAGILAYLNLRARFFAGQPTVLYGPAEVMAPLGQALEVMPGMEAVRKRMRLDEVLRPVAAGEIVTLACGTARAFALDHSVPVLGWAVFPPGATRPALVFAADSTTEPFEVAPELLDATVAIVECTFLEPNRRFAAELSKHSHLAEWVELAPRLASDVLVLSHLPDLRGDVLHALTGPLAEALAGRLVLWALPPGFDAGVAP